RGMGPEPLAMTLELLAEERRATQAMRDRVELVWTDEPQRRAPGARTTSAVVRSLFVSAERSVLVVSYALDTAKNAPGLFEPLRQRMLERPGLEVRLFVNIRRPYGDEREDAALVDAFSEQFAARLWPEEPRPEVFYDPRALRVGGTTRACLHAKCVVVDDVRALVTSANFTEAAHERNVEAGVLVSDEGFVRALRERLEGLVRGKAVLPVPGLGALSLSTYGHGGSMS
ncbi:MAG: DISARM system phospholipase D-like protein DrmC, partial [Myxococcales bacterium]|nr:DISARM system phospholipase D-like protein DrmC [Myxococcales bacterium]